MNNLARRVNYFTAAFLGILGITLIGEVIQEDDIADKIDDFLIFLLGLGAILWYQKSGKKVNKTVGSIVFLVVGLLIKIGGLYVERGDKEALGDDIAIFTALLLALVFVGWETFRYLKTVNDL